MAKVTLADETEAADAVISFLHLCCKGPAQATVILMLASTKLVEERKPESTPEEYFEEDRRVLAEVQAWYKEQM